MKTEKRIISFLLTFIMVASLFTPINIMAASELSTTINDALISKHGNVPLTLKCEEILAAGYNYGDVLNVSFLEQNLELPLCSNFSDVDSGSPAIFARTSDEYVLLAINMSDFATNYGIARKSIAADNSVVWSLADGVTAPINVSLSMNTAGGYYDEYILHQLSYTNERADYPELNDEQFANFRMVKTTGIGQGKLYRSASPVNPKYNRNKYADAVFKKVGINVIINLADDESTAKAFEGYDTTYYFEQKHIFLSMGMDLNSDDFKERLAQGLKFIAENPGIYGVHCTEGKDRAGFTIAIIECLMGASYDEVVSDYMVSFYNYYGITPDDARYGVIVNSNINKALARTFEVSDIKNINLSSAAEKYIKSIGLSDEDITKLKANLSGKTADISTVKANIAGKNGIMFTASVDSLKYREVGFIFEANGKQVRKGTNTVYSSIDGSAFTVSDFENVNYIYSFTIDEIADTATEIKVTPYSIDLKGNEKTGESEIYTLAKVSKVVPMSVKDETVSGHSIDLYGTEETENESIPVKEEETAIEPDKEEAVVPETEIVEVEEVLE